MNIFTLMVPLAIAFSSAGPLEAANKDVNYAKAPTWIAPPPSSTLSPDQPNAPIRVVYIDNQVRLGASGEEDFGRWSIKILKPEGLALGNVSLSWRPDIGSATVHYLRIVRDGNVINVLDTTKFRILERETGLEQAILDGQLTAALQVSGLQVGDQLEFAVTITHHEAAFGDHFSGLAALPAQESRGAFRFRLVWPSAKPLTTRTTRDLLKSDTITQSNQNELSYELRDPLGSIATDGAPARYNLRRLIEFSDFANWAELSRVYSPLFEQAEKLTRSSEIYKEAAKIAASSNDPVTRAQSALLLVQDRIRYVYVGLGGANYMPAQADETWTRRFGDCKAKTVVLMALLRELGIDATPVLVNIKGGDGTDERLPSPLLFDHVLILTHINGHQYWLDGTRQGDKYLDVLPPPTFRWALPLSKAGSDLLPVKAASYKTPQLVSVVDIDANAGVDKDSQVSVQSFLKGDEAYVTMTRLSALSAADADRALQAYWRNNMSWIVPDQVSWHFDERISTLALRMRGHGKPDWQGDTASGHSLTLIGAGFIPPDRRSRPKEQDQNAPWVMDFPKFKCWATTIHLPKDDTKWKWMYSSKPMNRTLEGAVWWRLAGQKGNVVRTVMSRRVLVPEISASEAAQVNVQIPTFDNQMSSVYQIPPKDFNVHSISSALPFADDVDWATNPMACEAPSKP